MIVFSLFFFSFGVNQAFGNGKTRPDKSPKLRLPKNGFGTGRLKYKIVRKEGRGSALRSRFQFSSVEVGHMDLNWDRSDQSDEICQVPFHIK